MRRITNASLFRIILNKPMLLPLANLVGGLPKVALRNQKIRHRNQTIRFLIIIISWHPSKIKIPLYLWQTWLEDCQR